MSGRIVALEEISNSKVPVTSQDADTGRYIGRLTTSQLLLTMQSLRTLISNAATAYEKIPEATPEQVTAQLDELIRCAKGIQIKAERLKGANQ